MKSLNVRVLPTMPSSNRACGASTDAPVVLVFGMSRSGTSLATSLVSSIIDGQGDRPWRGGGAAYPTDSANRLGYFERGDLVQLNYRTLAEVGVRSWVTFDDAFATYPRAINASVHMSSERLRKFEQQASSILRDMVSANQERPFVLKDVRLSRTLPLWAPLIRQRFSRQPVCLIPFRHPAEVALSSRMAHVDRVTLWKNYMLAALASSRAIGCPTLLLDFDKWFASKASASRQLDELLHFLQCFGVIREKDAHDRGRLLALVRRDEKHRNVDDAQRRGVPQATACLHEALVEGTALAWHLDGKTRMPCLSPRA